MIRRGFFSLLIKSVLVTLALVAANALVAAPGPTLVLKKDFATGKGTVCLNEIVEAQNLSARDAEKISRYCQIQLTGEKTILTAKDIELHSWAAGVIPEKISGSRVSIMKSAVPQARKFAAAPEQKVRRGSNVQLILKSEHMQIAREAAVLSDAFTGETVDVRPQGTRKTLRARLTSSETAELVAP